MQISPIHVAGALLTGGLATGGYFAYQALVPPTLEEHLKSLNFELISSNWAQKDTSYKAAEGDDLIPSIAKTDNNNFATQLQEWCEKKKTKPYRGDGDLTYKHFSLWCIVTKKITVVLDGRKDLKVLDETKKSEKIAAYNALTTAQRFIVKGTSKTDSIVVNDLDNWCQTEKAKDYRYEGDVALNKIINWCYDK